MFNGPARLLITLCAALGAPLLSNPPSIAAPLLDQAEVMPVSQIRPGMKGYGLTVFKGTRIERFDIEVLSIMPKANLGKPLILVRLDGGPITQRGAFGIQGMSGSPCYLNNRLIGAFAYAFSFPKEPIGMITPIEDMAEALDPRLPTRPAGMYAPIMELSGVLSNPALDGALFRDPQATTLRPLGLPVMVNGLSPRLLDRVAAILRPFHLSAVSGPGRMTSPDPGPLRPGAAIGVSLLSGDVEMTGVGTVTYRKGTQLLAFGHPMFQLGATNFPITTAYVHEIFPGFQISFKLASPVRSVGTLVQDRPFSVAGRIGTLPQMVPITCTVQDQGTGRSRTYHVRVADHPFLVSRLLPIAANQAIFEVHGVPGDTTAQVELAIDTDTLGTIRRSNVFFDSRAVDVAAVSDLVGLMQILNDNVFQRVKIKNVRMKVTLEPKRDTAIVERIFVAQDRYEPGETVEVGVVLRPYRGEPIITRTQIKIPENAAAGRATLIVSGGPAPPPAQVTAGTGVTTVQTPAPSPPAATNVRQLLRRFLERERNDQLVTRVQFSASAVNVNGETLSLLPSHLAQVMRSTKSTGVRLTREEVRSVTEMNRIVTGSQTLAITIERRDRSEKTTPGAGSGASSGPRGGSGVGSSSAPASLVVSDEMSDFEEDEAGSVASPRDLVPLSTSHEGRGATPPGALAAEGSPSDARAGVTPPARGLVRAPTQRTASTPEERKSPSATEASKGAAGSGTESGAAGSASGEARPETTVLGRRAQTWRQASAADFAQGTLDGMAVTATGQLRPAPSLKLLCELTEPYVWSVAAVGPEVYAGTGNGGLIYRVSSGGHAEVFYRTGELEVHALVKDAQGNLYAGTSPGGRVIRIRPDGRGDELLALNPENRERLAQGPAPTARFVLSLAIGPDGSIYAGTGPDGLIYRIPPSGAPVVFFRSPERYIQSLVVGPDGTVYAGTAESGLIYAIRPDGAARVLHDSDQNTITSLARDDEGNLYAATAPRGIVMRIAPDGGMKLLWDKSRDAVQALRLDRTGRLYAAAGSVIYVIDRDGTVTTLSDSKRAQLMAMDLAADGSLVAGSANVGSVYRLESKTKATFESAIHDAKTVAQWGEIRWRSSPADAGTEAGIRLETRSGNCAEPDTTWSPWQAPTQGIGGYRIASPPGRYFQYRVTVEQTTAPALQEVSVSYLPRNRPPTVTLTAPKGGEYWRGTATIRWTGSDPDRDTLSYNVTYSADGKTWLPVGRAPRGAAGDPSYTAKSAEVAEAMQRRLEEQLVQNPALARFREALAQDTQVSAELRAEVVRRAEELIARFDGSESAATGGGSSDAAKSSGLRETSLAWDTSKLPDGVYRVRVVASDRPSNPTGAEEAEAISDPIQVVNRPPAVFLFRRGFLESTGSAARIDGIATGGAPVVGAQFRVNGGDWTACDAADGIWDSTFEPFTCLAEGLGPGEYTVEVKVLDAAGNTATKTAKVKVS